jgi:dihydropteroate synthase
MGILNVTPDSFSDGGRYAEPAAAIRHGLEMAEAGADLIDVGGESTRPGARRVPVEEEVRRTVPVIRALAKAVRVPLSIDTSKAEVAEQALGSGASIVNDVTALRGDARMASVVARANASVILMHMRGTPETMQRHPRYGDVVVEVVEFLRRAADTAQAAGVAHEHILIDPGLGFGKTVEHNLQLMRQLSVFVSLGYAVVVGPSRKTFIGKILDVDTGERLPGTLACVAAAAQAGVQVVRVHEVQPAAQFVRMLEAIGR